MREEVTLDKEGAIVDASWIIGRGSDIQIGVGKG